MVLALTGSTIAPANAACPDEGTPVASTPAVRSRAAVLCLVNTERTSRGLSALTSNPLLEAAAQAHTDDMVLRRYFGHASPPPRAGMPANRAEAVGYHWTDLGENVAYGWATPAAAVLRWMRSPAHCRVVLNAGYLDTGVGVAFGSPQAMAPSGVWTQEFGRARAAPAPFEDEARASGCPFRTLSTPNQAGEGSPRPTIKRCTTRLGGKRRSKTARCRTQRQKKRPKQKAKRR